MPEWLLLGFLLGLLVGLLLPVLVRQWKRRGCRHEFIHLRGAFAYCHRCPARKRYLNG